VRLRRGLRELSIVSPEFEDAKVGNPLAFEIVSAPPKASKAKGKAKVDKGAE
jgi:ATP-dependent Clp protease ATP-binding subunit ClpA